MWPTHHLCGLGTFAAPLSAPRVLLSALGRVRSCGAALLLRVGNRKLCSRVKRSACPKAPAPVRAAKIGLSLCGSSPGTMATVMLHICCLMEGACIFYKPGLQTPGFISFFLILTLQLKIKKHWMSNCSCNSNLIPDLPLGFVSTSRFCCCHCELPQILLENCFIPFNVRRQLSR